MKRYGAATTAFLDRHPFLRRHRWFIAWSVAPFLAMGAFVFTHATPDAQASADPDVSCSSHTVVQTVGEVIKEHVFASPAKMMLDPDQFGGKLTDIATAGTKPLVCTAGFVPRLEFSKAVLDDAARTGATAQLPGVRADAIGRYTTLVKYKVRDNGQGKIYVEVIEGLDAFDD